MREIKFKAWDKEGKFMTDPFFLGSVNAGDGYDHEWEILQFTGLKDKNGSEIYDGDILKQFPGFGCEWNGRIGVATWDYASFWFKFGCQSIILDDHDCQFEVVGNVHENSELIPAV